MKVVFWSTTSTQNGLKTRSHPTVLPSLTSLECCRRRSIRMEVDPSCYMTGKWVFNTAVDITRWKVWRIPVATICYLAVDSSSILPCSTPIGRAGAFCVLSSVLEQLKVEGVVDLFFFIHALRQQQPGLVATFVSEHPPTSTSIVCGIITHLAIANLIPRPLWRPGNVITDAIVSLIMATRPFMSPSLPPQEQYKFCYTSVLEFLDSFDHYSNFDWNFCGVPIFFYHFLKVFYDEVFLTTKYFYA